LKEGELTKNNILRTDEASDILRSHFILLQYFPVYNKTSLGCCSMEEDLTSVELSVSGTFAEKYIFGTFCAVFNANLFAANKLTLRDKLIIL
jgi:hypothetical protein